MKRRDEKRKDEHDIWLILAKLLMHLLMWGPVLFLILFWQQIPDRIPTHYSAQTIWQTDGEGKVP